MSLVTRCPACTTTFKVVRDQLRISDGWVRCGRCSHVFDASLDLQDLSDVEPAPAPPAVAPPEAEPDPETPASSIPAPLEDADFFDEAPPSDFEVERGSRRDAEEDTEAEAEVAAAAAQPVRSADSRTALPSLPSLSFGANPAVGLVADEPWPDPVESDFDDLPGEARAGGAGRSIADFAPSLDLDPVSQVQLQTALRRERVKSLKIARARGKDVAAALVKAESATASTPVPAPSPLPEVREAAPIVRTASEPEAAPAPAPLVPSFLRAASSSAFWRRGTGLAIAWGAAALAAVLLLLQILHRERDAIAASQPVFRPVLSQLCALTGCELAALRRIDEITIDGAAFAREKVGDGYRLGFTLRSAASVPLAMPAVELSLLDTQEQVVVRRVLQPAEFGAPAVLAARAERAASLPLALVGTEAAALPPIAGYRVVAFYP